MKATIFLVYLMLVSALSPSIAADLHGQLLEMPMEGYAGHFREHCMDIESGQTLRLSIRSPYPVRVNVHHHADGSTTFLLDELIEALEQEAIGISSAGEYCLEVRNPESRPTSFDLQVEYQLSPD